jgi:membrane protease subunit HflC
MKNIAFAIIGVIIVVAGGLVFFSLFTVHQSQQALVLQFGEVKEVVQKAGLHWKVPWYDVRYYDRRVLDFDAQAEEVPTLDQKQLVVDAFARYRIVDPKKFLETVRDENGMEERLERLINGDLRAVFGEASLATLLTAKRSQLMRTIAQRVKTEGRGFGIDVIDVRIKRVDLPEENSQAIYRRMQTQREQEARRIRAEGQKDSRRIRAQADKQATIIKAEAQKKGQTERGNGDAGAQKIYNDAYGRDRDFFDFYVSMNALSEGLDGESTRYIGPTDGDFFRFFGNISGKSKDKK